MSEDMLSKILVRELPGLMRDFMKKVLGENGQEWIEAFKRFLKKQNPWAEITKPKSNLLEFVTEVTLPVIATFSTKDHFKVGEVDGVKIGWLGENFQKHFLAGDGKVETNVAEATLRIYRLKKWSVDGPVIAELGGEEVAETTLAQIFEMMKAQGKGQKGNLLTNGYANIFYIRDVNGILWAVDCNWGTSRGDWDVSAYSVASPYGWGADGRVVSR